MNENVQELEEVQIIAYGSQKKVTVTGALSSINNEELLKSPVASMANALTGKVTGLASVQSSDSLVPMMQLCMCVVSVL